jgi:hypothetical protein
LPAVDGRFTGAAAAFGLGKVFGGEVNFDEALLLCIDLKIKQLK